MNLVVDGGNTRFKVGLFSGVDLQEKFLFSSAPELFSYLAHQQADRALVSTVKFSGEEILNKITASKKYLLTHTLPLPIKVQYQTPQSLGVDRIAAACGVASLFPGQDCLAIDAGTCINYELVTGEGNYMGGGISPGLSMRLKAMHTFTERLPEVPLDEFTPLVGQTTESCMQSGVLHGTVAEIEGVIERYREKYPHIRAVLCGGDTNFFENRLKQPIFAAPDLVLVGLNRILLHNAQL
ncbi:MAG: type III pantothenate kinase [Bacteroidetes bacterium]|nr:type III pantothenate kinase [Bacteroidota bacterium]MBS1541397.1 type III pantothenate kinase [Bacteroidota bacterium]